jgi:hypothetical protein
MKRGNNKTASQEAVLFNFHQHLIIVRYFTLTKYFIGYQWIPNQYIYPGLAWINVKSKTTLAGGFT